VPTSWVPRLELKYHPIEAVEGAVEVDEVALEVSPADPVDFGVDSVVTAEDSPAAAVAVAATVETGTETGTEITVEEATAEVVEEDPEDLTAAAAMEEGTATTVPAPVASRIAADLLRVEAASGEIETEEDTAEAVVVEDITPAAKATAATVHHLVEAVSAEVPVASEAQPEPSIALKWISLPVFSSFMNYFIIFEY